MAKSRELKRKRDLISSPSFTLNQKGSLVSEKAKKGDGTKLEFEKSKDDAKARETMEEALRRHFESQFGALESGIARSAEKKSDGKEKKEGNGKTDFSGEDDGMYLSSNADPDLEDSSEKCFSDFEQSDDDFTSADITPSISFSSNITSGTGQLQLPQVVSYTSTLTTTSIGSAPPFFLPLKSEKRKFLSPKPIPLLPSGEPKRLHDRTVSHDSDTDDEALNLKNDLALQRLLHESHLIAGDISIGGPTSLNPTGLNRLKAIEFRIQSLGGAPIKQKMPVPMRLGLLAHRRKKEEKRVKEAKENGIVLEKRILSSEEKNKAKEVIRRKRKDRIRGPGGLGAPNVGRFRNGALLRLNKTDVREIERSGAGARGERRREKGGKGKGRKKRKVG